MHRSANAFGRLALFAVALVVVAVGAAGLGLAVGPDVEKDEDMAAEHGSGAPAGAHASSASGLALTEHGYRLVFAETTLVRGETGEVRFTIVGEDGESVRDFDEEGGVRVHLIVVRRDLVGYQHLHPTLAPDGTWRTRLTLADAGVYRAFADFEIAGEKTVLAEDLFVAGDFEPAALRAPSRTGEVDGYAVRLAGAARAGEEGDLRFRISRGGEPVELEPYLGARGHLVALRAGDLAYLHVHPLKGGDAGDVRFAAEFPSEGRYQLFLQFADARAIHTATFTLEVTR